MIWPFEYLAPQTLKEVGRALIDGKPANLLAGGTDLLVDMRKGTVRPARVIDLKKIEELSGLEFHEQQPSTIGATVTLNRIIEDESLSWDTLREAALSIGTYQVRNRATAVGNLCHASPAADMAPPLLVLGAKLKITNADGQTAAVPLSSFFQGVKTTSLKKDEWVTHIEIPPHSNAARTSFIKRTRIRGHDLASVNLAGYYNPESHQLRLAVGACAPTPRLFNLDDLCQGQQNIQAISERAIKLILEGIEPISDNRASAEYRREMVALFVKQTMGRLMP
jgi:carbon-monoxide dehydrogenase medium subunit